MLQGRARGDAQKEKEIFNHLTGGHKESAALREMKDGVLRYMDGLQELWDAGFDEIMGKGADADTGRHAGAVSEEASPEGTRMLGKHAAKGGNRGEDTAYYGQHGEGNIKRRNRRAAKGLMEVWSAQDTDATEMVEGQELKNADRDYYDYSKSFEQQVDDWMNGNFPAQDTLLIGRTPAVFKQIGLSDLPMTMDRKHLDYAINGTKNADHHIGAALVKQLPTLLETPLAIIESQTHPTDSVMAIVDATVNGKPAMAAVRIDSNGKINGVPIDSNHMVSVQGRNNAVSKLLYEAVNKENSGKTAVYYVDQKRGVSILKQTGLNISGVLNRGGLIHSIHDVASPVNKQLMEQTDTQQFKRWFGDSVVVNEDGTPKVMYHGTPYGGFTVFKDWQYFTDNKEYADVYHNPSASSIRGRYNPATNPQTYEVYLSVKKPFDTRDPKVRKLWKDEFHGSYSGTPLTDKGLPDWTDGIDLIDFIEENGYDYDAIILDEGGVGGYGDDVKDRGISVVVRNPTQIKSATDNVGTFDPENPDIRYSDRDLPDSITVREYLSGLKPTPMTEKHPPQKLFKKSEKISKKLFHFARCVLSLYQATAKHKIRQQNVQEVFQYEVGLQRLWLCA